MLGSIAEDRSLQQVNNFGWWYSLARIDAQHPLDEILKLHVSTYRRIALQFTANVHVQWVPCRDCKRSPTAFLSAIEAIRCKRRLGLTVCSVLSWFFKGASKVGIPPGAPVESCPTTIYRTPSWTGSPTCSRAYDGRARDQCRIYLKGFLTANSWGFLEACTPILGLAPLSGDP